MKPIRMLLMLLISGLLAGSAYAEDWMGRISIDLKSAGRNPAGKDDVFMISGSGIRNKWLLIRVEYYPQGKRDSWIDDVTLSMRAVCTGQSGGKRVTCVFSGETKFWAIPMDGRKHTAVMMIPPQLLDRYLPVSGSGSKAGTSTFAVQVLFLDKNGKAFAEGYYPRVTDPEVAKTSFAALLEQKPLLEIPNSIWPRNKTPWHYQSIDDMDLIKP